MSEDSILTTMFINPRFNIFFHISVGFFFILDIIAFNILANYNGFTSKHPVDAWLATSVLITLIIIILCYISLILLEYCSEKERITIGGFSIFIKVIITGLFYIVTFIFASTGIFIVPINYKLSDPSSIGNMAIIILFFQWLNIIATFVLFLIARTIKYQYIDQ